MHPKPHGSAAVSWGPLAASLFVTCLGLVCVAPNAALSPAGIPEPGTTVFLASGLVSLAIRARRKLASKV